MRNAAGRARREGDAPDGHRAQAQERRSHLVTTLRIALAQIDPAIGDLAGNSAKIVLAAQRARDAGRAGGAVPRARDHRLRAARISSIAPPSSTTSRPRSRSSRASCRRRGRARRGADARDRRHRARRAQQHAGDHRRAGAADRAQAPAADLRRLRRGPLLRARRRCRRSSSVDGVQLGITICEDTWNDATVWRGRVYAARIRSRAVRRRRRRRPRQPRGVAVHAREARRVASRCSQAIAKKHGAPVVYVNQVGGNDDLIFDGQLARVRARRRDSGARAAAFAEDLRRRPTSAPGRPAREVARDRRGGRHRRAHARHPRLRARVRLRASCSACRAASTPRSSPAIAARRARPPRTCSASRCRAATRREHSHHGRARARRERSASRSEIVPIEPIFAALRSTCSPRRSRRSGPRRRATSPSRTSRRASAATMLMAISNRSGALLLTTGNKSEVARRLLHALRRHGRRARGDQRPLPRRWSTGLARDQPPGGPRRHPRDARSTKPPSAELRPGPDRPGLAAAVRRARRDPRAHDRGAPARAPTSSPTDSTADGRRVARMVRLGEYKRRQMPPGLIVTKKAFGPGRRIPIAQRWSY